MSANRTPLQGYLFALAATVIWSGNFIVARGLMDAVPPVTLALLRWTTAVVFLLPFGWKHARNDWPLLTKHWRYILCTAALGITVFNTLIYIAAHTTNALNLSLISISSPVFILLFSRIFLGELITIRRLAGLLATMIGVVTLVTRGDFNRLTELSFAVGDIWMLCAAMIFGSYSILIRRKPAGLSPLGLLTGLFVSGWCMLLPWAAWEWMKDIQIIWTWSAVGAFLYIGIGASLTSFWCWNKAVDSIGPARAGLVYYSLPLFCGIEAVLLLGEPVGWVHFISGALILTGIRVATKE